MAAEIYVYNRRGLKILWDKVRDASSSREQTLQKIYKTYGKDQWESKCAKFNFYNY